jgi:uncharacterized protein YjbI with pentapeptide repeats
MRRCPSEQERARLVDLVANGWEDQARELCASMGLTLYLRDSDLHDMDLSHARLNGAELQNTDLRGAHLQGANLQSADLRGADLLGADLQGANLENADLRGADMFVTNLKGAVLTGARVFLRDLLCSARLDRAVAQRFAADHNLLVDHCLDLDAWTVRACTLRQLCEMPRKTEVVL